MSTGSSTHLAAADTIAARVTRARMQAFLHAVEARLAEPVTVLLVGEATLVLEGWRDWTDRVVCTVESTDEAGAARAIELAAGAQGLDVLRENPADVVPLPPGFPERARPASAWRREDHIPSSATPDALASPSDTSAASPGAALPRDEALAASAGRLRVLHFDPYSVALRLIARGDEPDYHVVLGFLEHGLVSLETMDRLLADLLPRFSSATILQDSAELRRKYKGLRQMWLSRSPTAAAR